MRAEPKRKAAGEVVIASVGALGAGLLVLAAVALYAARGSDWEPVTVVFGAVFAGLLVAHLGGALACERGEVAAGRTVLWVSVIPLTFMAIISGFSIGLFLLPAVLLAWVSVVASMGRR